MPNHELFWIHGTAVDTAQSAFAVAIPLEGDNFLEGRGALRALLNDGVREPLDLAQLTLLFLERGGILLEGPVSEVHREFGVTPPLIDDNVLSYWYERRARTYLELLHGQLQLKDLTLTTRSVHLQEHDHQ